MVSPSAGGHLVSPSAGQTLPAEWSSCRNSDTPCGAELPTRAQSARRTARHAKVFLREAVELRVPCYETVNASASSGVGFFSISLERFNF